MTQPIDTLADVAPLYDVIVFDQWGVLHDGTHPYAGAVEAITRVACQKAVLSNSGKRAQPNTERINQMGFSAELFDLVMTSGEALWQDVQRGNIPERRFHAVERASGDAAAWAEGLEIDLCADPDRAEAILMMGLPDGADLETWMPQLAAWHKGGLPMYCSNPDRQSPRAGGLVISPGALAHAYRDMGGRTLFYGKPHLPIFSAVKDVLGTGCYLMVGDSMEHDIAGAHGAGWDTLLIEGGLYAERYAEGDGETVTMEIAAEKGCKPPIYRMKGLR